MEEVGGYWWTMVGTLDIDKRASQVTQVEQVTNKDLSTCLFQFLRTRILSPHECANRESLPQKIQYSGRSVSASRRRNEYSWLGHGNSPLVGKFWNNL
jgi:hypothetical protein